jgi:hypothetical protein
MNARLKKPCPCGCWLQSDQFEDGACGYSQNQKNWSIVSLSRPPLRRRQVGEQRVGVTAILNLRYELTPTSLPLPRGRRAVR